MIGKDKKRLVITLDKKRAAEIERAAMEANRSVSNYLETIILKHTGQYREIFVKKEEE